MATHGFVMVGTRVWVVWVVLNTLLLYFLDECSTHRLSQVVVWHVRGLKFHYHAVTVVHFYILILMDKLSSRRVIENMRYNVTVA